MTYRVPPHVHFRSLHDEVVLLDTKSDSYLGLNQTAAVAWGVIATGGTQAEAATTLVTQFDVTPEQADNDTGTLVAELLAKGLIEAEP